MLGTGKKNGLIELNNSEFLNVEDKSPSTSEAIFATAIKIDMLQNIEVHDQYFFKTSRSWMVRTLP